MADRAADDKPTKPGAGSGHESPTTARELDFDDDDDAPAAPGEHPSAPPPPSKSPKPGVRFSDDATEIPPAKPPRPVSPRQAATNTLVEAFPGTDPLTVRGVLMASDWNVQKAFDVLLRLSDPDFNDGEAPPPKPPRPTQPRSQLEQDEMLARQLQAKYNAPPSDSRARGDPRQSRRPQPRESPEPEDQGFFKKEDLEEFQQALGDISKGAKETISSFFSSVKQQVDKVKGPVGEDSYGNEVYSREQRQNFGPSQSDQVRGIRRSAEARRSADHNRYDNDNRVLGDDFEALELRDDESHPNQRSNRPLANPDLFKPTHVSPPQTGPVDEVDALYRNPSPNGQQTGVTGNKSGGKKWQPLTSVAPHPESDEHDPFSLGDSDDDEARTKDIKAEDTERLKKAAEAKKVDETTSSGLTPAGRSGSVGQIDAAAEALLKEAK